MGLLVEDLLLLARLDQQRPLDLRSRSTCPRSPATPSTTPGPSRPTGRSSCTWTSRSPTPRSCCGDEGRLRQVVGNLVTNALTHTPAGTRGHGRRVGRGADDAGRPGAARSPTRARAWTRRTPSGSSSASTGPTPRAPAAPAAPGSGWRSSPRWSPRTAARSTSTPRPGKGTVVTVRLPRSGPADVSRRRPGSTGATTDAGLARPVTIREVTTNDSGTIPDAEPLAAAADLGDRDARS